MSVRIFAAAVAASMFFAVPAWAADGDPGDDVGNYRETAPKPKPPDEDGKRHEVALIAGLHLARATIFVPGLHYRYRIDENFSLRATVESGQSLVTVDGTTGQVSVTKLGGAIVSNGPIYGGIGMTQLHSTALSPAVVQGPTLNIFESIFGARLLLISTMFGIEFRWGMNGGASTLNFHTGYRF